MSSPDLEPPDRRAAPRPGGKDRRRRSWSEFRRAYPGILATMGVALLMLVAIDLWLLVKRRAYLAEVERLRADMTDVERRKADLALADQEHRLRVMVELVRRQARGDRDLHLSIAVDSGIMHLERDGARLREMEVDVGPARRVGVPPDTLRIVAPRGVRTVERVLGADAEWEVPAWVYVDRGLPVDSNRVVRGALGPAAIVLSGGTVIYAPPTTGPLHDPGYVMPGAIRVRAADLRAIAPNLAPGVSVYFY